MQNPIVPESSLENFSQRIREFSDVHRQTYRSDYHFDDPDYGPAFCYFVFFRHHPSPGDLIGAEMNKGTQFYNEYFWLMRLKEICKRRFGYDAGMEDQASQMLEHAAIDLDFEIVTWIMENAGATVETEWIERAGDKMTVQTLKLGRERFVVLKEKDYQDLKAKTRPVRTGRRLNAQDRGDIAEVRRRSKDAARPYAELRTELGLA